MLQPPAWDSVTISMIWELRDAIPRLIAARRSYDQLARAGG
jgi:hypothetical protein